MGHLLYEFSISHLLNPFNPGNASEIQQEAPTDISPGIDPGEIFIVGTGDTPEDINKLLGIDLEDLEVANSEIVDPDLVYPGPGRHEPLMSQ